MVEFRLSARVKTRIDELHADGLTTFGRLQSRRYVEDFHRQFDLSAAFPGMGLWHSHILEMASHTWR